MRVQHNNIKFEKEINGLRGIAILLVVLFHFEIFPFSGGFIGVDIFFVISGYLISKIIINKNYENLNYWSFVKNRIRRIFPGLLFMILFFIPFFFLILSPDHLTKYSDSILSNLIFSPNIYFWTQSNYFDLSSSFKPLLHTWSLGVEFHFYFIWPIIFIFLYKVSKNRIFLNLFLILIIILSLACLEIIIQKGPIFENKLLYGKFISDTVFFLTPFRIFEFIFGSLLAINLKRIKKNNINEILFFLGATLIVLSSIYIDEKYYFPSKFALFPLIGTFLIIYSKEANYFGYILRNKIINFFGDISYSLYLYHWPVYIFFKYYKFSNLSNYEKFFAFLVSIFLASLSFKYIEKFYLKKHRKIIDTKFVTVAILILIMSITINLNQGFKIRLNENSLKVLNNKMNQYGGLCTNVQMKDYKKKDRCLVGDKNQLDFLLVGDSHGKALMHGLTKFAENNNLNFSSYEDMCKVYPNLKSNIENCLIKEKPQNIIIGFKFYDYQIKNSELEIISKKYIDKIKDIKTNLNFKDIKNIIVIAQVPEFYSSYGDALSCYSRPQIISKHDCDQFLNEKIYKSKYQLKQTHRFEEKKLMNNYLKKYASKISKNEVNLTIFDPFDYLCENLKCMQVLDGNLIYSDATHLSKFGSQYLIKKIESELIKFVK